MSSYYDFSRCAVCRSKENLINYHGKYEVTMLLNTLYLSLMFVLEKRQMLNFKTTKAIPFLKDNNIVDTHNNRFSNDDIARYLRNALAHFNIYVAPDPYDKRIELIKLWGQNEPDKPHCKEPCAQLRCLPQQYNANTEGEICSFTFSVEQLRQFVDLVTDAVNIDNCAFCSMCQHKKQR